MSIQNEVGDLFIHHAQNFLSRHYLPKIERCLEKLNDEQIWWRPNPESNSIGNLVLHLCGNARQWIIAGVGASVDSRHRDAEFAQREAIVKDDLLRLLRSTVTEVDNVLGNLNSSTLLEDRHIQGLNVKVLEAVFHVTEHFSMHTGQIITLTKMLSHSDLRILRLLERNSG